MIFRFEDGKPITTLPHKSSFDKWKKKLDAENPDAYQQIECTLNTKINEDEIHTAGWMPGHNWEGTPYYPLYIACNQNIQLAGMFFGLIVFKIFMERDDEWYCGKFSKDGKEIGSMTYYKKHA